MATQDPPSLYERLGGVCSIATVIDDFIDRIRVDRRLDANPRVDEAHHRVSPAGFKYLKPNDEFVRSRFGASGKATLSRSVRPESNRTVTFTGAPGVS
jgi:hypothetical protein